MFARLAKICRSKKTTTTPAAARPTMFESLEDRQLCSVSPAGLSSYSWGMTQTGTAVTLPAVQHPGGANTNIIVVLIAL